MLGRRIGRYGLFTRAHPAGDDVGHGFGGHMVPRRFGGNLAVGVPRISGLPEPDSALIGFDASRHEISGDFGRVPEKHQQNALSHRVQGACVSYLFLPQPFESVGTLGGREPAWLVDHKKTVLLFHMR